MFLEQNGWWRLEFRQADRRAWRSGGVCGWLWGSRAKYTGRAINMAARVQLWRFV